MLRLLFWWHPRWRAKAKLQHLKWSYSQLQIDVLDQGEQERRLDWPVDATKLRDEGVIDHGTESRIDPAHRQLGNPDTLLKTMPAR